MELSDESPDALSVIMSRDIQIENGASPEFNNDENTSGSGSKLVDIVSYATYENTEEETYSAYDTDTDDTDSEEWLEQNYLHESVTKLNTRQKCTQPTYENEQKFSTYRKTNSKEQSERKLPSSYYKLDKQTILTLEMILDVRPIGQYHEAIGKGKHTIVISIGQSKIQHGIYFSTFVNAIKIYKLTNDENLNKAIYKRVETEYEHLSNFTKRGWLVGQVPFAAHKHKNILVMSIIGSKEEPAVPLSKISPDLFTRDLYDEIVTNLSSFYNYYSVHGKICTGNVLIWRKTLFYVGWSKASFKTSPSALENLIRDFRFVTKFFKSKGVQVMPVEELLEKVTKLKKNEIPPELLDAIHKEEPTKKCHGNPNRKKETASSKNSRFK